MAAFEYRQAEEIRNAFARHGVHCLFICKSGAILLGFPDTTQDADLFVEKSPENGWSIVAALRELGFTPPPCVRGYVSERDRLRTRQPVIPAAMLRGG